jgi:outer membrane protein insertion porin family
MRMKRALLISLFSLLAWAGIAVAGDSFSVSDIKVEGLQRISEGTVFNYLPVQIGDKIDTARTQEIISALYKTGFFKNITLLRDGDVLIIKVLEQPSIASITVTGNDELPTDDLMDGLKKAGLTEGRVLDVSLLDRIKQDLQRQYFVRGFYAVQIEAKVEPTGENQVNVQINIQEGEVARIRKINIIGARHFDEDKLLDQMQLGIPAWYAFFSDRDQYSKQKLAADFETLKSYYLDRGYINFNIESAQVTITPDRKSVFITLNIHEGEQYSISSLDLSGELIVPKEELEALVTLNEGDIFSRRKVNDISTAISDRLGNEGYAFANVNAVPEIDSKNKQVAITFFVDPGKRVYVRRINISGNEKTEDEVIRREFRQMEGAWLSTGKLNRSQVRVQRLSYLEQVTMETPLVPGSNDEVDVNMSVSERASGSLMVGLGYSDSEGLLLNGSISQDNFFGTGKRVSAEVNTSKANKIYSFTHTDPYYTLDGVSRSLRLSYRKTDASQANLANYLADVLSASMTFGIPMSEYDTVRIGLGYDNTSISTTGSTPQSYLDFLSANTDKFDVLRLSLGWSHDTRDKTVFATEGVLQSLTGDVTFPVSGLDFYKISSRSRIYFPLSKRLTSSFDAEINYGDSYGDTTELPFFERFYAGGAHSVRGYRANSLGPRENNVNLGGDFRVIGGAELIFPPPFGEEENSTVRMSLFWDIGNVFNGIEYYNASELRQSTGLGLIWLSPIGPLSFSVARPLNDQPGDSTESFQFTLGTLF